MVLRPPVRLVEWPRATRIIASRYPPIHLFERLSGDPRDWEAAIALEQLTNPRLRDEIGEIALVPAEERVSGPGASWVMAPFAHRNPKGSRLSDGSYGVYYAARAFETALRETAHHWGAFARDSRDPPRRDDMRVLVGAVAAEFHDIAALRSPDRGPILDTDSYATARDLGRELRHAGSNGVVYPSVRHAGGTCIGAFRPKAVGIPIQTKHLQYEWDGTRVTRYFDYGDERWVAIDEALAPQ
jgi:hypothetical protein